MPLASPPTARLGSLENGSQLPLVALATLASFATILAFFTLATLAALITLSQSWLAPTLAFALAFALAFTFALYIAQPSDTWLLSS